MPCGEPVRSFVAKLPSVQITRGSISSIWRIRCGLQASISSGCGSRLSGGRHFRTFAIKQSLRERPISSKSWSSSLPALPTKGLPCWSSWKPGASPTNMRSASALPVPNTTVVRVPSASGHFWQSGELAVELDELFAALLGGGSQRAGIVGRETDVTEGGNRPPGADTLLTACPNGGRYPSREWTGQLEVEDSQNHPRPALCPGRCSRRGPHRRARAHDGRAPRGTCQPAAPGTGGM